MASANVPLKTITISGIILATVLAAGWAIFHHPVPEEEVLSGPWSICGTPISAPYEVLCIELLADSSLTFGIRDGQGEKSLLRCQTVAGGTSYERLLFYPTFPHFNGTLPDPVSQEITNDRDQVRNVLFYAMAHRGFHSRSVERKWAYLLYPSRFDLFLLWWRGGPY
jgi:hypothetical protein